MHRLALRLDDGRTAERTLLRHLERLRPRLVRKNRADDLRDDVTCPLDDHVSPSRMSLRLMSSSLCKVACETVTPPTSTGSSCAHGLSAPVLPTRMWILFSLVRAVIGAHL